MSLLNYFKKQSSASSPNKESGYLTHEERKAFDEHVKRTSASEDSKKRGAYNIYIPAEWAAVGKYSAKNGPTRAAKHFTAALSHEQTS